MAVSHLSQLSQLQDVNTKLKRMYTDLAPMRHALKNVVDQKLKPRSVTRWSLEPLCPSTS